MNSSAASICYVASTHTVFPGLITHQTAETNAPSETPDDSARPVRPDPSADAPEPSEPPLTTLATHRATVRLLPLALGTMLADLGTTMLLGQFNLQPQRSPLLIL